MFSIRITEGIPHWRRVRNSCGGFCTSAVSSQNAGNHGYCPSVMTGIYGIYIR